MRISSLKPIVLAVPLVASTVNASETEQIQPIIDQQREDLKFTFLTEEDEDFVPQIALSINHSDAVCTINDDKGRILSACSSDNGMPDMGRYFTCNFTPPSDYIGLSCNKVPGFKLTDVSFYLSEEKIQVWFEYSPNQEN